MRYFMEKQRTGWWTPSQRPERYYISRDEALKMISPERLEQMEQEPRSKYQSATMQMIKGGSERLFIGIEYDKTEEVMME